MINMKVNLLLIARRSEDQKKYLALSKELDADITAVSSFKNMDKSITDKRYHGLLVDFPTKFWAMKEDKEFVNNIMEKFPVLLLRLDKKNRKIKALYIGQTQTASLEDFINNQCRSFTPRRFRYRIRKQIHFNVTLSGDPSMDEVNYERTTTIDVSRGGCFIFTVQKKKSGDDVWFVFEELNDQTPIYGIIRHVVPWRTELRIPGIGVEFMKIKDDQLSQICEDYYL